MPYEVSTAVYEGPFDLLLHLITKEEVDIYEVSLAPIVDAYLAELERMERVDLEIATEFLLIAATLVELKARRLLPGPSDVDLDDELLLYEQRDLLLARLLECKTFKDAAVALAELRAKAALSAPRTAGPEEPFASMAPDPLERVTVAQLHAAAVRAFTPTPVPRVSLDHVAPIRVTVREAMARVLGALPRHGTVSFRQLTAGVAERLEVIVRFLAVLELYKRGVVDLEQEGSFGELRIRLTDPDAAGADFGGLDEEWDDAPPRQTAGPDGDRDRVALGVQEVPAHE